MSKIVLSESSAPDTPPIGKAYLYVGTDKKYYLKDSDGAVSQLSSDFAGTYTVATLPTGVLGIKAVITDGDTALAWGATAINSGSGATTYLVWYNGTNWTILGT